MMMLILSFNYRLQNVVLFSTFDLWSQIKKRLKVRTTVNSIIFNFFPLTITQWPQLRANSPASTAWWCWTSLWTNPPHLKWTGSPLLFSSGETVLLTRSCVCSPRALTDPNSPSTSRTRTLTFSARSVTHTSCLSKMMVKRTTPVTNWLTRVCAWLLNSSARFSMRCWITALLAAGARRPWKTLERSRFWFIY